MHCLRADGSNHIDIPSMSAILMRTTTTQGEEARYISQLYELKKMATEKYILLNDFIFYR